VCGGSKAAVPDVFEEAVIEAFEQSAHVHYRSDPGLHEVDSIAAFRRY
jgi:hypothetical protein